MMDFLFGADMPLAVRFFFAFVIVLALIGGTAFLVRRFGGERLGASSTRGRQPRLAVIDAAAVDGRRRLILIRRDNVEHLLMIGGPSDVVVEANIVRAAQARDAAGQRGAQPEALPRALPANDGSMWPPPQEPAVAPPAPQQRPARQQQPMMDEPIPMQWNSEPEPPLPPRRPEPRPEMPRNEMPRTDMMPRPEMPRPEVRPEPRTEMRPELRPDIRPEPRPEMRPEPRIDMRPEPRVDMRPEPRVDMRTEPRPDMRPEPRPDMRPEPRPDMRPEPRTADPLAGLAAELARVQPDAPAPKSRPQPREIPRARGPQPVRPVAPPPADDPPEPNADQNLAEMAQRLEAALRRPKAVDSRGGDAPPKQPMMPPAPVPMQEPAPRSTASEQDDQPAPAQRPARAAAAPKPQQKSVYDSLEQEMASLLGRPNSKA
jgi:flagellar protein FliO/FliZ